MGKYLGYRRLVATLLAAGCLVGPAVLSSTASAQTVPPEDPRLFAADSAWSEALADDAPLDPSSDLLVGSLQEEVQQDIDTNTGPWINTGSWSTPLYTVPADQPTVRVQLDSTSTAPWRHTLQAAFEQVPIPPDAEPADGTDGHLTVWQPSTDRLWEFWKASNQADGWHARWGGAIENVSEDPGHYTADSWPGASHQWGATATGMPVIGGVMLLDEFEAEEVDHALALNIPRPRAREYSWPAQGTDGTFDNPARIPEGARFRIDPALDLDSLALHPVTRMMAEAAQRYGIVVRDKSGSAVSFSAEDFAPLGFNPYQHPDGGYFQGQGPNKFLRAFPWDHLQLLQMSLCTKQSDPCPRPADVEDTTPPTIQSVSPSDGATGVASSTNVVVTFSEPMDRPATEAAFGLTQSGLPVSGGFSWNGAGTVLTFDPSSSLATGGYEAGVATSAADAAGNPLGEPKSWSFTVDATPATTVSAPSATVILAGNRRSGNAGSLSADDGAYYSVNSTTSSTRRISWYGRFDGVSSGIQNLAVTYSGSNSRSCSQTIAIRRFTTGSWVVLNSRSVGTTEVKVSGLTPPGAPADYVSGTGQVQVRLLCKTTSGSFYSSGDLLQISRK